MAKKEHVDVRALKDEIAEFLKKQKWEKAAEVQEKLVAAEPKDMSHRLKLGDTYRRMEQIQKSINSYQIAARTFADEGQLIKAIGAVKIILEIDPKNEDAQAQLQEMNNRRFGKVTLESAGLKRPGPGIGAGARATSAAELAEAEAAAHSIAHAIATEPPSPVIEPGADDEPLELDDGKPSRPAIPQRGFQGAQPITPGPPPRAVAPPPPPQQKSYDLSEESSELDLDMAAPVEPKKPPQKPAAQPPPPPKREEEEIEMDLGEPEPVKPLAPPPPRTDALPLDAILTPQAEDLAVAPEEDVISLDDEVKPPPPKPAAIAPPPPPPAVKPAAPQVTVSDEITFEEDEAPRTPVAAVTSSTRAQAPPPTGPGGAQPIADLLSSDSEEEIELLSMTTDEEVAERPHANPKVSPDDADLDSAFGKISSEAAPPPRAPPKKVPLFDDMPQEAFVELVNKLHFHRHVPGQLIIKEGDPGRSFYVIVEGKVRIFKVGPDEKEITLAHLGEGAFFGEMALLSGAPRTANVIAEEDTEILEVTDVVLRELATKYPQVVNSLKNFYRQRLLNNVMAISPLFKDFDPGERKSIVEKFRMKQAAPSEVLITEGKNSDGLYVVLHGGVQVATRKADEPIELARLKEGDIFGEMSLLTRKPATATVTSQGNAILLRLPRENFQELVLTHPQILELVSDLTERRKSATEAILQGQGPGHDGMSFV